MTSKPPAAWGCATFNYPGKKPVGADGRKEGRMKAFEWMSPTSFGEAVTARRAAPGLTDIDEAPRPIAGGQDLLTTMKDYITRPSRLVNLKGIRGLDGIDEDGKGGLRIGALVTLA